MTVDTFYEAEDNTNATMYDAKVDTLHRGASGGSYVDMGSNGSYIEFFNINGGLGGICSFSFRYASGASNGRLRPCAVTLNGKMIGSLDFRSTRSWGSWKYNTIQAYCKAGVNDVRVTAGTANGGPNLDGVKVNAPFAIKVSVVEMN